MKLAICCVSFLLLITAASGIAFGQEDVEGSKDHPMLSRMPKYQIIEYDDKDFDSYEFQIGAEKIETVEGHKTVIQYQPLEGAKAASGLQIRRNYANAITKSGGRVVFEDAENIILTATTSAGAEIWIHVWNTGVGDGSGGYKLTIVEREAMKQDVTANDILSALNQAGRITLYINFDTGKSIIKSESETIVKQIVAMMKENPDLKISIEGHTDNVGNAAANLALSEQRAKAVMNALVAQGIAANRLSAVGFGQTKPATDNSTEEGRAKNRRVELVKK